MKGVVLLLLSVVVGTIFVVIVAGPLREASTTAVTDLDTVTTGAAETTGTILLPTEHWFTNITSAPGLQVTCATDAAPGVALGADRTTVSLTGLTVSTVQVCTTTYLEESQTLDAVDIIELGPFLMMMGVVGIAIAGGAGGLASAKSGKEGPAALGVNIQGFAVVLVGAILIPVLVGFVNDVDSEYTTQPEFVGVTAVTTLVVIGYVFTLFGQTIGLAAGVGRRSGLFGG